VLGFASLPVEFFLILIAMILGYLVLAELVKARFYEAQDRPRGHRLTPVECHHRRVRRRAARFAHHLPVHVRKAAAGKFAHLRERSDGAQEPGGQPSWDPNWRARPRHRASRPRV